MSEHSIDRRDFLKFAAATAGVAAVTAHAAEPAETAASSLTDVNVNLSQWPFRRLPFDDTPSLVAKLRSQSVVQAWASSFDAILHKDVAAVNTRLATECREHGKGLLIPFGCINPKLSDWQEELRRCSDEHQMPGIRLHPNYHGYKMDDPDFARLLKEATERGMIVQLAMIMEERRTMHSLLQVEPTNLAPLPNVIRQTPRLRLVLLNALYSLRGKLLMDLINAGNVYVEIGMLEGVGGVKNLLSQVPVDRVLFGSYAPFFYFESSLLKLKESPLSEKQIAAISSKNAQRLLTQNRR